jgi:hypothetical protein
MSRGLARGSQPRRGAWGPSSEHTPERASTHRINDRIYGYSGNAVDARGGVPASPNASLTKKPRPRVEWTLTL